MTGDDEPVVGVGFEGVQNPHFGSVAYFGPRVPEAGVNIAIFAEIRELSKEIHVHPPIRQGLGTSKCEHNELVRVVNGNKTRTVGPDGVLELKGSVRPCSFNERAVSNWTGDQSSCTIVVARAVCSCRVLRHQPEVLQQGLRDAVGLGVLRSYHALAKAEDTRGRVQAMGFQV